MNNETDRMFTQDEVNAIVSERLKKERIKIMQEVNQRETELNQREALIAAKADWTSRGLPAELLDSLDMSKEGAIDAAAAILEHSQNSTPHITSRAGFASRVPISLGHVSDEEDTETALRSAMGLNKKG